MYPNCTDHPEQWLPVVGYEGVYEVSSCGRVRRCKPFRHPHPSRIGRTMKQHLGNRGYPILGLAKDGTTLNKSVHRLVCESFHGGVQRPSDVFVNHRDGCKTNNHVENLEWVTHQENVNHAIAHGLSPRSKLTPEDVTAIRRAWANGESRAVIARRFGVVFDSINGIVQGRYWKHLDS